MVVISEVLFDFQPSFIFLGYKNVSLSHISAASVNSCINDVVKWLSNLRNHVHSLFSLNFIFLLVFSLLSIPIFLILFLGFCIIFMLTRTGKKYWRNYWNISKFLINHERLVWNLNYSIFYHGCFLQTFLTKIKNSRKKHWSTRTFLIFQMSGQ